MEFVDAHDHLQDGRFAGKQDDLVAAAVRTGVVRLVVNGTGEADWPDVADLARRHPQVVPSFGCHPWYLGRRTPDWRGSLERYIATTPGSAVGEIGLDRWMLENPDRWRARMARPGSVVVATVLPPSMTDQEEAFVWQLRLAAARDVPVSIHCLDAWGRMIELLREGPRPARGFLLHSYGGPVEMVAPLAELGARFGFPGYFLHERKARRREVFREVPPDRLLIETDAPDQSPPRASTTHPLIDPADGEAVNHPANLAAVYRGYADFTGEPVERLAARVRRNFTELFGV
jgi:TatD DNase family protein